MRKLTPPQVREIRAAVLVGKGGWQRPRRRGTVTMYELSIKYGVCYQTVYKVRHRISYQDVK